jgi:hypothetical protein
MQLESTECDKWRWATRAMQPCQVHIARSTASVSYKSKSNYIHFLVSGFWMLTFWPPTTNTALHEYITLKPKLRAYQYLPSEHTEIRSRLGIDSRVSAASCFLQGIITFYLRSVCRLLQTAGCCVSEKFSVGQSVVICNTQATFLCHL